MLIILDLIITFFFGALSILTFSLPSIRSSVDKFIESFDLFYRFIFGFLLNALESNYITAGTLFLVLFFVGLLCTLIVHGNFIRLIALHYLLILGVFVIYPFGTAVAFVLGFFVYTYKLESKG